MWRKDVCGVFRVSPTWTELLNRSILHYQYIDNINKHYFTALRCWAMAHWFGRWSDGQERISAFSFTENLWIPIVVSVPEWIRSTVYLFAECWKNKNTNQYSYRLIGNTWLFLFSNFLKIIQYQNKHYDLIYKIYTFFDTIWCMFRRASNKFETLTTWDLKSLMN
jgi:hypothetical protein